MWLTIASVTSTPGLPSISSGAKSLDFAFPIAVNPASFPLYDRVISEGIAAEILDERLQHPPRIRLGLCCFRPLFGHTEDHRNNQ
jgi:hypothetical protein